MTINVAINGFGRIGRLVLRALYERQEKNIKVVAINDLGSIDTNAHLFTYDSVHGKFQGTVEVHDNKLCIEGHDIHVVSEKEPNKLPWDEHNVDIVFECTGRFTKKDLALGHIKAGAKKVLVSAPCQDADKTIVYGVNHQGLMAQDTIVSNASCTTNCLSPVAYILDREFGIVKGYMTTIHSYTGDQPVLDVCHKDLRRARAAALSMIPTSTGAAKAVGLVLPHLSGRLDGTAIRVPTPNVSLIDFVFQAREKVTVEAINKAIETAANQELKNVLAINKAPLVSIDFQHNSHSSIFDATQTQIVEGDMVRVLSWYDNEWGFSNRMLDTAAIMGSHLA